jgi:sortase A
VVGTVGKVLIATGLLMFAFVGYQLWGTGIEYARAQDRLDDEFDELLASASTTTTTTIATPETTAAAPPQSTTTVTTAPPPTVPEFAPGDVLARIEIPTIGLDAKVVSGVQPEDLKQGPGHYPDTPMPGQFGNSAIAGHRTTYGQPFYRLDEVAAGDEIVLTTVQGRFVYRATGSEVVDANRSDVVATTDPTVATLTLTTCHPRYSATRRLIVSAELDEAASAAPQQAIVADAEPEPTVEEPVITLPGEPVPSTTPPTASTEPTSVPSTVPATTQPADVTDEVADAFAHGWFSDDGAWPQVALWGLALTGIAIGSWLLSRRVGHNWVGALAGIVPFVVCLYFFFQNVNRLLPAAL